MAALSGKLLVVYKICAAEHDIFCSSRGDTQIFKMSYLCPSQ